MSFVASLFYLRIWHHDTKLAIFLDPLAISSWKTSFLFLVESNLHLLHHHQLGTLGPCDKLQVLGSDSVCKIGNFHIVFLQLIENNQF